MGLVGYSDSDWTGNEDHRKSTFCYCFKLNESSACGGWLSEVQGTVTTATAGAGTNACVSAAQECAYLTGLWRELSVPVVVLASAPANMFTAFLQTDSICQANKVSLNLNYITTTFSFKTHPYDLYTFNLIHDFYLQYMDSQNLTLFNTNFFLQFFFTSKPNLLRYINLFKIINTYNNSFLKAFRCIFCTHETGQFFILTTQFHTLFDSTCSTFFYYLL